MTRAHLSYGLLRTDGACVHCHSAAGAATPCLCGHDSRHPRHHEGARVTGFSFFAGSAGLLA